MNTPATNGKATVSRNDLPDCESRESANLEENKPSEERNPESSDDDSIDIASSSSDNEEDPLPKRRKKSGPKGRTREAVWKEFVTTYDKTGKVQSNKCNRCGKQVSSKAIRMKKHLNGCKNQRKLIDATVRPSGSPASSVDVVSPSTSKIGTMTFPSNTEIKSRMQIWKTNDITKAKQNMDTLIGKLIFSANLPFALSNNPFLEQLVTKAQIPKYKVPNPQKIGGEILDQIYNDCTEINMIKFKGRKVIILQDGWSTNQNAPVICHSIQNGSDSLMFDAIETGTNKKNAEYCFKLLDDAIKKAEKDFKCTVVGIVTDNCSVMKNMREHANKNLNGVHTYGCVAHILNLCGQEMTDNNLIENIIKIQKFFRNHHYESAALLEYNGTRPLIPGKTRWNSQLDTLESYTKNHLIYLRIARDVKSNIIKNEELVKILNDGNVYSAVANQLANLKPVAVALDKVTTSKKTQAQ